ncbi:GNAT family N-acetyltransferase [Pukyongiella litopenaei]|uniref:GNAT family N-acetyltransferase n=1 Tax=Pukyongiella litopenaei TaxID=2605946 RepID=A0A2S0MLH8_9RHOB|nr:GNAT family protein [Pukyongiella litopenaei]AVO36677.1 GNAT family N-acetyltransferase [Pukyongiella litopenaei]
MTDPTDTPVGAPVPGWSPPPVPGGDILEGRHARLEPLNSASHGAALFRAVDGHDRLWTYMPYGPFETEQAYCDWVDGVTADSALSFYAIFNRDTGAWGGVASYLRIAPEAGSIEVGHINLAPGLAQTAAATEAIVLMMGWAFEAGYRRFEWKCDALNRPSRRAAQRLGLSYEGIFRQAVVVKGRNRDTAWFAAIDKEWPALRDAYDAWLAPSNFDADGRQKRALGAFTTPIRVASDPTL